MDASLTEIAGVVTAVGGMTGVAIKYLLDRVASRQTEMENKLEQERTRAEAERVRHELKLETERLRWEALMTGQIGEMRREMSTRDRKIDGQERQIGYLRDILNAYLNHIAALENVMRAAGIQIPRLVLPDYPQIDDDRDDRDEDDRRRRRHREIETC